jgi:eukaryotic-like serine/threonine-protein kinase
MAAETEVLPERYDNPRLIGQGGMGEIFLARDRELGRRVAVKILDSRFADDVNLRRRFRREALTAARLSTDPHIVTIFDVGEWQGRPYIVMEYLPGGTLRDRMGQGPVPHEDAIAWLTQAAAALDTAHADGIVHRDIKPANLLFNARDELEVADFGIARAVDDAFAGMTAAGTVLGTAGYLSPEQARGEPATRASDVYALAVVAFELLTGGRPFERGSATAEAAAHVGEAVPSASERAAGLSRAVDAIFERGLAKSPADRYGSAGAFVAALAQALRQADTARTRPLPVAAAPPPPRPPVTPAPTPARTSRPVVPALAGGLLLAALMAGGIFLALAWAGNGEEPSQSESPGQVTVTEEVTVDGEPTTVVQTVTTAPEPTTTPTDTAPATQPQSDLTPTEAAALNDEAFVEHMQQGDYEGALQLLELAVPALQGTYSAGFRYEAYAEYNLGKTLAELGRCDEALPHLERSEQLQGERQPITAAKEQCGA